MYKVTLRAPNHQTLTWDWIIGSLSAWMHDAPTRVVRRTQGASEPTALNVADGGFDAGGIITSSHPATRSGAYVYVMEFSKLELRKYTVRNNRRTRHLGADDWIQFNKDINAWLDDISARHGISSDVQSSSYVVRDRNRARTSFTPGNFHGIGDAWKEAV